MILYIVLLGALSSGASARAAAPSTLGRFAVDAAFGWDSDYGIFGGGLRAFPTENWDVHVSGGVDAAGPVAGAGTAIYFDTSRTTCWFFFSCKSKWSIKTTALRSYGNSVSITDNNVTGKYRLSGGRAASATLGSYQIFGWGFTTGFEVGWRAWWERPKVSLDSGTYAAGAFDQARKLTTDAFEVAFTIGWRF